MTGMDNFIVFLIKRATDATIIERSKTKRWVAACCAVVLLAGVLTGGLVSCSKADDSKAIEWVASVPFDIPEFSYEIESIPFPSFIIPESSRLSSRNHIFIDDLPTAQQELIKAVV